MSSLMDTVVSDLEFECFLQRGVGAVTGNIIVRGIRIPRGSGSAEVHDPLVDIWCVVRKKVERKWQVSVVGCPVYTDNGFACALYVSTANVHEDKLLRTIKQFEEHFGDIVELFMLTLDEWIIDEKYGYLRYLDYVMTSGEAFDVKIGRIIIDGFLRRIGLKSPDVRHDRRLKRRIRLARHRAK